MWTPSSGKLLTREQVLHNPWAQPGRFLSFFGMNVRFFNIQNTNDMLVDYVRTLRHRTTGRTISFSRSGTRMPWSITPITWPPISSTKTPPSKMEKPSTVSLNRELNRNIQWKCQYERSLIQPDREVMDICPGEIRLRREKSGRTIVGKA